MNLLRRLPLSRLLLLCALVIAIGASATAIAFALDTGPTPPPKPLAQAVHDALAGAHAHPVQGVSASVTWTDHLLEGANLAGGGQGGAIASGPLAAGASGRLWIGDGKLRLELQSQKGDTQVLYDGRTLTLYDAATNTEYRYTPPAHEGEAGAAGPTGAGGRSGGEGEAPSVAKIEEAVSRLSRHADVSGAVPTDLAGQGAYTVRVSPKEGGSLLGGVELSFDAHRGVPLRAAVYSSSSSTPVIELAAGEVSYGPVEASVFELDPPPDVKVEEVEPGGSRGGSAGHAGRRTTRPKLTTHGHGPSTIAVLAAKAKGSPSGEGASGALGELPKVSIDGTSAGELRTELGTLLSFERGGVRYLIAGAVPPAEVEAVARGL
ncbi:MAG TPA: hypothetical protein VL979_02455 [Solirubrobacteraceae bacterium]|nr:hypothetical protein [Solirubrobacteraceae bacterium]